jgi:hypothetical protein
MTAGFSIPLAKSALPRQPLRFLLAEEPHAGKTRHDDLQLTVSGFSFALHRPEIRLS